MEVPYPDLIQRLEARRAPREKYRGIDRWFSLDYMGSSEFEFGVAFRSQFEMAANLSDIVIMKIVTELKPGGETYTCWFVGHDDQAEEALHFFTDQLSERPKRTKESTYINYTYGTSDPVSLSADGWWAYTEYARGHMKHPWAIFKEEDHAKKFFEGLHGFKKKMVEEGRL